MDNSLNIGRLILITLLAVYEIYAFGKSKPLKSKLLPAILLVGIGLLFFMLIPFVGIIGSMAAILILELSLMFLILVIIGEIGINLFNPSRNIPKLLGLGSVVIILIIIYNLAEKVF